MSKPTKKELAELAKYQGDSESYHAVFDGLLEDKLRKLDPQWITEMLKTYKDSGCERWCA